MRTVTVAMFLFCFTLLQPAIAPAAEWEEPFADFSFAALLPPAVEQPRHCSVSYQWPAFIAGLYERGEVLSKNLPKAAELYLEAASRTDVDPTNQGFNAIRYKLGILYLEGVGVEQDYVEAYFWVSLAAAKSEKYSGAMARLGEKVPKERVEEVKKRVVEFLAKSQPESFLHRCTDVTPNFVRELTARRRAAENGNPLSQTLLAESYVGAYDYEEAAFWAALALSNKTCQPSQCQAFAYNVLDRIIDKLTPEQKSEIRKRVKEWKPQHMALGHTLAWDVTDPVYTSAQEGNAAAQYDLAVKYQNLQGRPEKLGEAYVWYSLAAKAQPDNKVYSSHRDAIKAALTPREVEILDGRIRTWKPTPAKPVAPDKSAQ